MYISNACMSLKYASMNAVISCAARAQFIVMPINSPSNRLVYLHAKPIRTVIIKRIQKQTRTSSRNFYTSVYINNDKAMSLLSIIYV